MNTTDITIKFPKKNEFNINFADEVCIGSVFDFQKEFNEKVNDITEAYNEIKWALKRINVENDIKIPSLIINLNTPGGDCYAGLAMHDLIKDNKYPGDINIIAQGHVMSMGIPILLSIPFEGRFAYSNTTFMIHSASGLAIGCVDEIEDSLAEIKRLNKIIYKIITDNTKITQEQLEHYEERKKDWIIDAQTALELGLISKIL